MDDRTILRRGKEELISRGLHKGGYCATDDGTGPVCMSGAINVVVSGSPYRLDICDQAWQFADELLAPYLPSLWPGVPCFNDAPSTTLADAVAVFDRAIAALAPQLTEEPAHA